MRPQAAFRHPFPSLVAALLLSWTLAGCAAAPAPVAAPEAAAPTRDLSTLWVRTAAEHDGLFYQIYEQATERLEELAAGREPGTWAVALDADETVIDNSGFQVMMAGRPFDRDLWTQWVDRAEAPPLPGVLPFLARVQELGGRIAIVTNRDEIHCPATVRDFDEYDIPYDVILCRTTTSEKEPRWDAVEQGTAAPDLPPLEIVMWLGDNIQDFPGAGQELKGRGESAHERFGDDWFLLPNPMYGSWD